MICRHVTIIQYLILQHCQPEWTAQHWTETQPLADFPAEEDRLDELESLQDERLTVTGEDEEGSEVSSID